LKGDFTLTQWENVMRDHPQWWNKFNDRGELLRAREFDRAELFRKIRIAKIQPFWPINVLVAKPMLCRGLA
jgi:hypothetical protein